MKPKLLFTSICLLFVLNVSIAQTRISGGIYTNTTWTLANSPYLMDGNVVVFPGVTLTIEPGVEVRVLENPIADNVYYLETRGIINMVGTPTAKITFRANSDLTKISAWKGIVVKSSQGGSIKYDYVNIANTYTAVSYDALIPDSINIHQSTFKYNHFAMVVGKVLNATDCNFYGNMSGVYGWSIFNFENCLFDSNLSALGIYVSSLTMNNCTIKNNDLGIRLNSGAVNGISVKNTLFENNKIAFDNANNGLIDSCYFIGNEAGLMETNTLNVKNTLFRFNKTALKIGFSTSVSDCDVLENETGVALGPIGMGQNMPIVVNNKICYNTRYNIDNQTDLNLYIPTNCFCLSETQAIEEKIFDGYDDITKGLISYAIFDTSCNTVLLLVKKSPVSGVQELNETVSLYPNPFEESITINNIGSYQEFKIFTIQGQLIQEGSLMKGENILKVSQIPSGNYLLGLYDRDGSSKFSRIVRK